MKLLRFALTALLAAGSAATASAQVLAHDDAAAYNAAGNTWTNGMNLGFGFAPWTLRATNNAGGFAGSFIGDGGAIATTGNSAWGLYANGSINGSQGNASVAYRGFTNGLPANAIFRIKWRNTGIGGDGNPPFHQGGFALRNGNANASVDDYLNGARLAFYYFGGVDDNFRILDAAGANATGLGFGTGPFQIDLLLLSADTYRLIIKNPAGTAVITNFDGTLAGSGTIDSVAIYNLQCDGNQIFNSMEISTTSLLAPDIQNVSPANGSAYVSAAAPVSFTVASPFTGVSSNNVSLSLNGTNITGLSFSGSNGFWSVTKSAALVANRVYNAQVIATDFNGNKATNSFTFNTWSENNFFIEAEAYNYSSGGYIPSPFPGQYDTLGGIVGATNGIDFLEFPDAGTNGYRTLDPVDLERSGDSLDHAGYSGFALENWMLSYVQSGEWLNYTRRTSNTTYNVYARMSGGGNQPVMLMERLANPTATSSNQPLTALGTFVGTNTSDVVSNFTFVPLKDFFSSNVLVRFSTSGLTTNTFRLTRIGDGYNFDYLIFVPSTDASTLRPYLATGFPFPNAANVSPDQQINFAIANRQTTVNPGSIQLFVNNVNVTSGITTSNNAAGAAVSYTPAAYYAPGSTSTVSVVYTDSGSVTQTNTWQFTVANVLTVPASYALSTIGANRGFNMHIAKAPNSAPGFQFPATAARAEAHLANLIINTNTGLPWTNEAGAGLYSETNVVNYNQVIEFGSAGTFGNDGLFPLVPATLEGSYTNDPNFISLETIAYAQLTPGIYRWAVRSDDGFRLTFGTGANPTNLLVGSFEGTRNDATASEFEFIIQTNGLYPFRLLYYEGDGFANVELYSINRTNGQPTLINDLTNVASVVTYRTTGAAVGIVLLNPAHTGNTTTFNFVTQAGKTHTVEYKNTLTAGPWQTLTVVAGTGATTNIVDSTATVGSRFYRVSTP